MKVLAIGDGALLFAREIFPDADIDTTTLKPGKKRTDYDSLISYMCLQTVPYRQALDTVKSWVEVLRTGGEITLLVPSLEWAAEQVFSRERSPVLMHHLFGTQGAYHASAYTLLDLRSLCSMAGIAVTHAASGEYTIGEQACGMNTVRGLKK